MRFICTFLPRTPPGGLLIRSVYGILPGFVKIAYECRQPWKSTRSLTASRTCQSAPKPFGGIFDYDQKHERLTEVNRELEDPSVWNNPSYAQELGRKRSLLAQIVETLDEMHTGLADAKDLLLMSAEEEDQAAVDDVAAEVERLREALEKLEFRRMFSGEMDANNAYLDIQAGSPAGNHTLRLRPRPGTKGSCVY